MQFHNRNKEDNVLGSVYFCCFKKVFLSLLCRHERLSKCTSCINTRLSIESFPIIVTPKRRIAHSPHRQSSCPCGIRYPIMQSSKHPFSATPIITNQVIVVSGINKVNPSLSHHSHQCGSPLLVPQPRGRHQLGLQTEDRTCRGYFVLRGCRVVTRWR